MNFIKNSHQLDKSEIIIILAVAISLILVGGFAWFRGEGKESAIGTFEECVAAGNPIMETYPEQCRANDQNFIKEGQSVNNPID